MARWVAVSRTRAIVFVFAANVVWTLRSTVFLADFTDGTTPVATSRIAIFLSSTVVFVVGAATVTATRSAFLRAVAGGLALVASPVAALNLDIAVRVPIGVAVRVPIGIAVHIGIPIGIPIGVSVGITVCVPVRVPIGVTIGIAVGGTGALADSGDAGAVAKARLAAFGLAGDVVDALVLAPHEAPGQDHERRQQGWKLF
jgi:hypothetical protein